MHSLVFSFFFFQKKKSAFRFVSNSARGKYLASSSFPISLSDFSKISLFFLSLFTRFDFLFFTLFKLTLSLSSRKRMCAHTRYSISISFSHRHLLARKTTQIENELLKTAHQVEQQLDDELHKMSKLNEEDLEDARRKRLEEMRGNQTNRKEYLRRQHGEVNQLMDEKEFFSKMKGEEKMVCHFYRNSEPCKVMTKHLRALAPMHLETLFCEIDAEKSPYLTEKLKIFMLPTLALVSKEKVMDYIVGMDDFGGGGDDFPTKNVKLVLQSKGMVDEEGERMYALKAKNGGEDDEHAAEMLKERARNIRQGRKFDLNSDDENSDFDD